MFAAIESAPMGSDEYRRLCAAFLTMAQHSDLPNVQTRWLALAQACSSLAHEGSTHARISNEVSSRTPFLSFMRHRREGYTHHA